MAEVMAFPPPELPPLRPGDELLTADELRVLSLFNTEHFEKAKNQPTFEKFPGTIALRSWRAGDVVCTQGEAGMSAFYILTTEDVIALRQAQLAAAERARAADPSREDDLAEKVLFLEEQLQRLGAPLRRDAEAGAAGPSAEAIPRRVASAKLLLDPAAQRKGSGLWSRLTDRLRRKSQAAYNGDTIPIDALVDIDPRSMEAPLCEGELFGEMSCMNRSPRSATVVVEHDCWMLELLRNVADMLHRDPKYRQRMDELYRKRVMELHIRRLSVFRHLTDYQFEQLREQIELVDYPSGNIIFEEGDPSDAIYIVRSGMVKIVVNVATRIDPDRFDAARWTALCQDIAAEPATPLAQAVRAALAADVLTIAGHRAAGGPLTAAEKDTLIDGLHDFIRNGDLQGKFGRTTRDLLNTLDEDRLREVCRGFPDEPKNWSQLELRLFHRELLELSFPNGMPQRLANSGPRRVQAYAGRGEVLGEVGVVLDRPRGATCVAYDHPETYQMRIPDSRMGAVPSRVELLRIPREVFENLVRRSSRLKRAVRELAEQRVAANVAAAAVGVELLQSASQSVEFEDLGLIQGQKLMLIDLERCTRCSACVDACIGTHSDGHSRLYLEGPRFGKYLVPLTCRQCRDPVCMIGCPVGAINRGEKGEIQIRDWCIGCRVCADQCPYGSIQMHETGEEAELRTPSDLVLAAGVSIKTVSRQAVVCDQCRTESDGRPACVYHCPHDAALRVDAVDFFLSPGAANPSASGFNQPA